tara:strand:- start:135 stop:944 length:810 start_codon:yes stop_codon:yes gene_type:complete
MNISLHTDIHKKIDYFLKTNKIPNIIFHGPPGGGKHTIVNTFINNIYNNNKELLKAYVMYVNCAHGKGIKFVREELKFFAKTHINIKGTGHFKTIVMTNADKLTIDAQSALRRCIESFSHSTRFFIIVGDRYKLLKPILSRFCEIFVSEPVINDEYTNLHNYSINQCFNNTTEKTKQLVWLKKYLDKQKNTTISGILKMSNTLYEKGYSGLDISNYLVNSKMEDERKYQLLLVFDKIKGEFRNEKLLIFFMFNYIFIRSDIDLENMSFM